MRRETSNTYIAQAARAAKPRIAHAMLISAIVGVGLRSGVALATANPATWNGNSGTSSSWGDVANWNGTNGNPDGGGTGVVHFAGSNRLTPNNDYGAFTQFNQIQFDSGASSFQLNGNVIKLFGSGTVAKVENNSANAQTVNFLDGSNRSILMESAIELDPTGGDLTINGGILADFNSGQISVFGGGGHTLTLNGSFTQNAPTGSIVNQTNNTIVLNANNSYTGDTQILAGKLQFGLNGKADSSTIRLGATGGSANAELDLLSTTGGQTIGSVVNPRAITSGIITVASQNTSGTNTFFGHFGLDHALTITQSGGGTLVFNQAHTDGATAKTGMDIKGFTVTFAGPGAAGGIINVSGDIYSSTGSTGNVIIGSASSTPVSVTLSGINTYSGTTTLNSGSTLNINSASALSTGVLTIGGGCTIDNASAGNITLSNNNALTLSGGSLTFTGTHDLNFGTGTVTISGAASRTITTTAGTLTFGGSVTDAGPDVIPADSSVLQWDWNAVADRATSKNEGRLFFWLVTPFGARCTLVRADVHVPPHPEPRHRSAGVGPCSPSRRARGGRASCGRG